jgi:hypothetical protein
VTERVGEQTLQATVPPARNVPDLVVTVVGFALTAVLGAGASLIGLMLVMASDSCGVGSECSTGLIGLGVLLAVAAPWLCWVPALVVAIIRQVRHRLTWWLPVVAGLAYLPLAVVAFLVVDAGVRPTG